MTTLQLIDTKGYTQLYSSHPLYADALAKQIQLGKSVLQLTTYDILDEQIRKLESAIKLYIDIYGKYPAKMVMVLLTLRHADLGSYKGTGDN